MDEMSSMLYILALAVGVVSFFGMSYQWLMVMIMESNDKGSETNLYDFCTKGLEGFYGNPEEEEPPEPFKLPDWVLSDEEKEAQKEGKQ